MYLPCVGDKGIGLGAVGRDAAVLRQEPCAAEDNLHGQRQEKKALCERLGHFFACHVPKLDTALMVVECWLS